MGGKISGLVRSATKFVKWSRAKHDKILGLDVPDLTECSERSQFSERTSYHDCDSESSYRGDPADEPETCRRFFSFERNDDGGEMRLVSNIRELMQKNARAEKADILSLA